MASRRGPYGCSWILHGMTGPWPAAYTALPVLYCVLSGRIQVVLRYCGQYKVSSATCASTVPLKKIDQDQSIDPIRAREERSKGCKEGG
jgi:hypothetical protein